MGSETVYWLSIPTAYSPPDVNSNGQVDAEDLAQDLQPLSLPTPCTQTPPTCAVVRVYRWDSASRSYESWESGSATGTPFVVEPGAGIGVAIQAVGASSDHIVNLVGANNPSLTHTACWSASAANLRWVSIPPHLRIDDSLGLAGILDAEDLGYAMGGPDRVAQIRQWDPNVQQFRSWVVGSQWGTPFEVDLSRAYAVDLNCPDRTADCTVCTWEWTPPTY